MDVAIVVPVAAIAGFVLIFGYVMRTIRSFAMQRTIREALKTPGGAPPELLAAIEEPRASSGGDGRIGLILVALSLATFGFGLVTGDADDIRNLSGMALFPLFVGLALLGWAWWERRQRSRG